MHTTAAPVDLPVIHGGQLAALLLSRLQWCTMRACTAHQPRCGPLIHADNVSPGPFANWEACTHERNKQSGWRLTLSSSNSLSQ